MNTGTLVTSLIMAAVLAVLIAFAIRQMMRGWLRRAQRQAQLIGTLPPLPDTVGPALIPATKGLYVGSTLAPSWLDRIAVGDLGYRTKAVLTRYPEGIMLQRTGAGPIWIPDDAIAAIRTEKGIAGKAMTHEGILAIRWRLPSGAEIDTGFRADDRARVRAMAGGGGVTSKAVLVLEDGRIFTGTPFGAVGQTLGEAVFSTGMSGYQETLTDPSYHGQIVVATAPQIGNTGWNHEDAESRGDKIWVAGYAVRDPSPRASNWRATGTLEDELVRQRIVGIAGIDTRAVVRHLRSLGSMKAGVFSGDALADPDELLTRVRSQPSMLGANLAGEVSTDGHLCRGIRWAATLHRRRDRPRHQDQHAAQLRQAQHPKSCLAVDGDVRADRRPQARRGVPVQRAGRPGDRRPHRRRHPRGARRRHPAVRHLLRQPDPR